MFYKKVASVNSIFQRRGVSTLPCFFNSSAFNFLPTQYKQVSIEGKCHRAISGVSRSVNTLLLIMLTVHVVRYHVKWILLVMVRFCRVYTCWDWRHEELLQLTWPCKKGLTDLQSCALLHADIPHSTHSAHFKSCWWKNHFKKQRGTVRTIASEMAPTWIPGQNSLVQHYVLSCLVALWKTVLPLTRSPRSRASMALSWINLDVYIWIEKQWGIMECCSDAPVAFWCWFTLKRLFGKQRTAKRKRRKTCKDFLPNLCMCGGNTLSKNSALQVQTYFLWNSSSIFIRIEKPPLPHHNICPYLYREAWEKNSKKSTSCNSNERPSIMFLS